MLDASLQSDDESQTRPLRRRARAGAVFEPAPYSSPTGAQRDDVTLALSSPINQVVGRGGRPGRHAVTPTSQKVQAILRRAVRGQPTTATRGCIAAIRSAASTPVWSGNLKSSSTTSTVLSSASTPIIGHASPRRRRALVGPRRGRVRTRHRQRNRGAGPRCRRNLEFPAQHGRSLIPACQAQAASGHAPAGAAGQQEPLPVIVNRHYHLRLLPRQPNVEVARASMAQCIVQRFLRHRKDTRTLAHGLGQRRPRIRLQLHHRAVRAPPGTAARCRS